MPNGVDPFGSLTAAPVGQYYVNMYTVYVVILYFVILFDNNWPTYRYFILWKQIINHAVLSKGSNS